MRASLFRRMRVRDWQGPNFTSSFFRPYVLSEPVPVGESWLLVSAMIFDSFPNNQQVYLYAVPGPLAQWFSGPNNPLFLLQKDSGGVSNSLPVSSGVLLGSGGAGVGGTGNPEALVATAKNYVNGASRYLSIRWRKRGFWLSQGWGLLAAQDADGGGAANFSMKLSIAYLPFAPSECVESAA